MIQPLTPEWVAPLSALLIQVWPDWYGPDGKGCARSCAVIHPTWMAKIRDVEDGWEVLKTA